jgi:AsmA protein
VNIDSIFFNIDKDYFSSIIKLSGFDKPYIYTKLNSSIDLEKWDRALGLAPYDVKGKLDIHFNADGRYATTVVHSGLHQVDTVVASIPKFNLQSSFTNGYFKYPALPQPISDISFNINASCPDSNYHHAVFDVKNINAKALSNYINGYINLSAANDFPVDANLQALIHLAEINQFYPLDSIAKKLFPVSKILLSLKNGSVQTNYYPKPIEKILVDADITSTSESIKDLHVNMRPISFEFVGHPFTLKANLKKF